jgi:FixJ family two-component response regulator
MISLAGDRCDKSRRAVLLERGQWGRGAMLNGQPLIAVIDDDDSLRFALVALVRSIGHEARGFGSAEDFLHDGTARNFSCIISDIHLPGMTGIDLKYQLTAQGIETPVIIVTARAEAATEARALASGAVAFLRKPFDGSLLIDQLEQALRSGQDIARRDIV